MCVCERVTTLFYALSSMCSQPRKQLQIKPSEETKRRTRTRTGSVCVYVRLYSMNSFYTYCFNTILLLFTGYYSYFTCYTLISRRWFCCCFVFFYLSPCVHFPLISFSVRRGFNRFNQFYILYLPFCYHLEMYLFYHKIYCTYLSL